ncbi:MAG: hypothetical protein PVI59_14545 [Anaerolineae bacterium]
MPSTDLTGLCSGRSEGEEPELIGQAGSIRGPRCHDPADVRRAVADGDLCLSLR